MKNQPPDLTAGEFNRGEWENAMQAMPESYYEKWESLYRAEKRAFQEKRIKAWRKASKRLRDHENMFGELRIKSDAEIVEIDIKRLDSLF